MKRCVIMLACLLLAAGELHAGDKAKPNTLTPKEIQDGWLLLFDGETTFGWKIDGEARIVNDYLVLGGKKATMATFTTKFREFVVSVEVKRSNPKAQAEFILGQGQKASRVPFPKFEKLGKHSQDFLQVYSSEEGKLLIGQEGVSKDDIFYGFKTIEGLPLPVDSASSISIHVPAGQVFELSNIKLSPNGLKSIFNRKNLAGWKEFPGKKSKFSVTKEGWLNVKNGPGDLQTTGKWKDFVLQLECLSNGKHLNSGVFFRCLPDQYQQGYESQIHNGFTPETPKTYTLEKFDPLTNKLIDKFKAQSPAIDYGTGAIYRRQPARKQMSKDFEWFSMTVVAHGRHMATWVNGVQVTDFDDYRPLNDNARNGCCLNAGPISIQGHDPTTDLSFRNFRIAEMK